MAGAREGRLAARPAAVTSAMAIATPYTTRHPNASPMIPDTVRASTMPQSRPPITDPTTAPRLAGAARSAAIGRICWGTVEATPTHREANRRNGAEGASAASVSARTRTSVWPTIRLRRSTRSPSGTSVMMPSA